MAGMDSHYEQLLAEYSNPPEAIALLRQYRPYLEMVPSLRRAYESIVTIPLPVVRIRHTWVRDGEGIIEHRTRREAVGVPCDVAILMCDPEWKIKMGVEVIVLIHRRDEDFSDILGRWRRTQILLDQDYEWLLPSVHEHMLGEGSNQVLPLFVISQMTPERIARGLKGARLPFVVRTEPTDDSMDTSRGNSEEGSPTPLSGGQSSSFRESLPLDGGDRPFLE